MSAANPYARQTTFLGHPVGLYVLFFSEMWERFSYYGMRALLVLYMVNLLKWEQGSASTVYKWYTSLVYLTPLVGGYLADRWLGNTKAVIIGSVLMAIGQFLLAYDAWGAGVAEMVFYSGLGFLIVGNGFFKPNMSTQVGRLYPPNDRRRDGAYTIFYMGINLGAFLAPLICGELRKNYGFQYGFLSAGIGMLLGLVIYVVGLPLIKEIAQTGTPAPPPTPEPDRGRAPATAGEPGSEHVRGPGDTGLTPGERVHGIVTPPNAADRAHPDADVRAPGAPLSESEAARTPSAFGPLNVVSPGLFVVIGLGLMLGAPVLALLKLVSFDNAVALEIAAVCALISAWVISRSSQAVRDRVLVIYILGLFVVFFWAAFEQAGNAMNLWADQSTDRYLTTTAPFPPDVPPPATEQKNNQTVLGFLDLAFMNPVSTESFQSINALAIFLLAPVFAWLWTKINLSIPFKMALGIALMGASFILMLEAARRENQPTSVEYVAELPKQVQRLPDGKLAPTHGSSKHPYHAGRLTYDPASKKLNMTGVLTNPERERILSDAAPDDFRYLIHVVSLVTAQAGKDAKEVTVTLDDPPPEGLDLAACFPNSAASYDPGQKKLTLKEAFLPLKVKLPKVPPGFDLKQAGFDEKEPPVTFDADSGTLTVLKEVKSKEEKLLKVAAADPDFRAGINELYVKSSVHRVSSWWLFWFYILATLGELCLSPVGLSMVSKLAPAKFATMLMGLWLLTSFFGHFVAGSMGENYDKFTPTEYFLIIGGALLGASLVLLILVPKVRQMMHGVN